VRSEIHKLTNSICSKEEMPLKWKQSATPLIYRKGDKTECSRVGNSPATEFYMPTFRNTLSVPSS